MVGLKTDSNYVEGQTLDNTLFDLFVLPVRYVSVMIQRRSGTLRI